MNCLSRRLCCDKTSGHETSFVTCLFTQRETVKDKPASYPGSDLCVITSVNQAEFMSLALSSAQRESFQSHDRIDFTVIYDGKLSL